jgi:hypothetical protein
VFVIGPNVPAAPAVPGTTFRKTSIEIKSIPGQGNASPPTLFENHAVVQLVGASAGLAPAAIFDPSYGQKYDSGTTLNASRVMWEDASIMRFVYEYANGHEEYHPNGPALETTWQLQ